MRSFGRAGLVFDVRDQGPPDGEVVVLLHGFPATAAAWDRVADGLNAAGYRTLAPDQRGYSPGARPAGRRAYRIAELSADVVALLDAAGAHRAHVVGHDWGGAVAWDMGARHPDRLASLTSVSTPHPAALTRSMLTSTQALRSTYMLALQVPVLPELLARRLPLRRLLAASGLPEQAATTYAQAMQEPGAFAAAIAWYRAVPLSLASRGGGRVDVPTLYVWSTADAALGRRAAELTGEWVRGPYTFVVLDDVSHWIPETAPDQLLTSLLPHLQTYGAGATGHLSATPPG